MKKFVFVLFLFCSLMGSSQTYEYLINIHTGMWDMVRSDITDLSAIMDSLADHLDTSEAHNLRILAIMDNLGVHLDSLEAHNIRILAVMDSLANRITGQDTSTIVMTDYRLHTDCHDSLNVILIKACSGSVLEFYSSDSVYINSKAYIEGDLTVKANLFVNNIHLPTCTGISVGTILIGDGVTDTIAFQTYGNNNWAFCGAFNFTALNACKNNLLMGEGAGGSLTIGSNNIVLGHGSFRNPTNKEGNIVIGINAGTTIESYNIVIGENALLNGDAGNIAIGRYNSQYLTDGDWNVSLGYNAAKGLNSFTSEKNVFIGSYAAKDIAHHADITGNTVLGSYAGYIIAGDSNVFIGYRVGYNETGSNKLYIDNSDTGTPLIYGDFSTDELTINGDLQMEGNITINTGNIMLLTDASDEDSLIIYDNGTNAIFNSENPFYFNQNVGIKVTPSSTLHVNGLVPGTIGSHPAGQLIIQNPTDDVNAAAVITGYESDAVGAPDQQLWYLGSSSGGNESITFLNRRNANLTLGTSGTARMTISGDGAVDIVNALTAGTITSDNSITINTGDTMFFIDPSGADSNLIFNTADTFYVGKGDNPTKIGNSLIVATDGSVSTTGDFTIDGDFIADKYQSYGGMGFSDSAKVITLTNQNEWYQVTGLIASDHSNNVTMAGDSLDPVYAGDYEAMIHFCFKGETNGDIIEIALAIDGTVDDARGKKITMEITNQGKSKGCAFHGYYTISVGQAATLWVRNTVNAGNDITAVNCRIHLTRK